MKIIAQDNFNREHVSDKLVAENVTDCYAPQIAEFLNLKFGGADAPHYFKAVRNDYKLYVFQP